MRLLLAIVLLAACSKPPPPPPPPAPRTTPIAPGAPLQVAIPDEVRVKLDINIARTSVQSHYQQSGKYPPSLGSLGLKLHYPNDLRYDPSTGTVTSNTYPRY